MGTGRYVDGRNCSAYALTIRISYHGGAHPKS